MDFRCLSSSDTLAQDALTRDFTLIAVYYDPDTETFTDPCDGIADIKKKILRTIKEPSFTLSEDLKRLVRAVRFQVANKGLPIRNFA